MIDTTKKTYAYYHICKVYDEHIVSQKSACGPGCAECCTINVTLTSLEGFIMAETMHRNGHGHLFSLLENYASRKRYIPLLTLNRLAEKCFREEPVPDEANDPEWGRCPFLIDNQCPIYEVRPFACRCMVSEEKCRQGGYALMPPFTVAVNRVVMQYIEHVDQGGFTGNLIDVLGYMKSEENRNRYRQGLRPESADALIPNSPARHLLVEPEYKESIAPLLAALNRGG